MQSRIVKSNKHIILKKLTYRTYLEIEAINTDKDIPDVDKALYTVCSVYGLTEQQLDSKGWKKVEKMVTKVENIFKRKLKKIR